MATKHTGRLSVVGAKSPGSVKKPKPPSLASVSNDFPCNDVIRHDPVESVVNVFIRRKLLVRGTAGSALIYIVDRIVRIRPRSRSRLRSSLSSGTAKIPSTTTIRDCLGGRDAFVITALTSPIILTSFIRVGTQGFQI